MAKVTFIIKDADDGSVNITCDPPIATLLEKLYNTSQDTPAERYAIACANRVRDLSEEAKRNETPIYIPKMVRPY